MGASEELKRFENDLRENPELREKLDTTAKRIADAGEAKTDGDVLVKAAAELGYSFTLADLDRATADVEEVDPEELELAAGGDGQEYCSEDFMCRFFWHNKGEDEYGHNIACFTAWHCHTVMMHTETTNKNARCWSDYICMGSYHCLGQFE